MSSGICYGGPLHWKWLSHERDYYEVPVFPPIERLRAWDVGTCAVVHLTPIKSIRYTAHPLIEDAKTRKHNLVTRGIEIWLAEGYIPSPLDYSRMVTGLRCARWRMIDSMMFDGGLTPSQREDSWVERADWRVGLWEIDSELVAGPNPGDLSITGGRIL